MGAGTLFANAESGGTTGTLPTDTATAAINIAHNPAANVAPLYGVCRVGRAVCAGADGRSRMTLRLR